VCECVCEKGVRVFDYGRLDLADVGMKQDFARNFNRFGTII